MSEREEALRNQVVALTRDCHYLISLLNSTDEIDWESWSEGKKIKADLEWSQELLEQLDKEPPPSGRMQPPKPPPGVPEIGIFDPFWATFYGGFPF